MLTTNAQRRHAAISGGASNCASAAFGMAVIGVGDTAPIGRQ